MKLPDQLRGELHRIMKLAPVPHTVALVGGGGKTTSLLLLAAEATAAGRRAAVLTTTHIGPPRRPGFTVVTEDDPEAVERGWAQGLTMAVGRLIPDGRLQSPSPLMRDYLQERADALYVEADGSKGLPLKYPADWEPALPDEAEQVLLLCGLSALGQPVDTFCHRARLMREELGETRSLIDEELMAKVLAAGYGRYRPRVVINHADTPELAARGRRLAALLAERGLNDSVVLSLHNILRENGGQP